MSVRVFYSINFSNQVIFDNLFVLHFLFFLFFFDIVPIFPLDGPCKNTARDDWDDATDTHNTIKHIDACSLRHISTLENGIIKVNADDFPVPLSLSLVHTHTQRERKRLSGTNHPHTLNIFRIKIPKQEIGEVERKWMINGSSE